LADIGARIEDAGLSLRDFRNDIDLDPLRLEQVEERLELLKGLKRKYGGTVEEVLALKDRLASRMEANADQKARLQELEVGLAEAARDLLAMAAALSRKRKQAARALEKAVEKELEQLHMAETRFQVRLQTPDLDGAAPVVEKIALIRPDGMDRAEFMISPNVGEALRPLSKIASGGELSRVMLALKTILSRTASVETVIFDEVDAGIGGATAEVVGEKLVRLGRHQQVICITHLPQIASQGSAHFLVRKEVEDGRTQTAVLELGPEERVEEIARLLGGREITPRALAHAREMLAHTLT
jgi:DNA repair protein RecN (Recombination protein N)